MENHGKTMEKHGKMVKSTMFLGRNLDEQLLKPLKLWFLLDKKQSKDVWL
jgi:hypothetical protein